MLYILQVDFPYRGPWKEEMASAMQELAVSISEEPGLIWKIWTEDATAGVAGGVYLFSDLDSAQAYLSKHTLRLQGFGITSVNSKIFQVNESLSRTNRAPM